MAVGDNGKIYKTTNNGFTWLELNSGTSLNLNGISLTSVGLDSANDLASYYSYVVGQNGIFLRSFNSGGTWSLTSIFTQDLYNILILQTYSGFALGASNSEYFTTTANGGTNWLPILNTTNGGYHLYSGTFITGQNTCHAVGSGGRIRRTTNWGNSWTFPVSNTTKDLFSIIFADANTGWLCGQNGFIERSTNSGFNWVQQFAPNYNHLRCITFINNLTGWIVGDSGVVLRTDNGGITGIQNINNETPVKLKLCQNFPNPFNPTTMIKYDLQSGGNVKLNVYDITGCFVEELVNEYKYPGEYYVEFDGINYASGIYIYKIEMDENVSIKLMNLIK